MNWDYMKKKWFPGLVIISLIEETFFFSAFCWGKAMVAWTMPQLMNANEFDLLSLYKEFERNVRTKNNLHH